MIGPHRSAVSSGSTRRKPGILLTLAIVASCARSVTPALSVPPATQSSPARKTLTESQSSRPTCEPTFLAVEGAADSLDRITGHEVAPGTDTTLGSVTLAAGWLRYSQIVSLGDGRVAMSARDQRFSRYAVLIVDLRSGTASTLIEGDGPPPRLGALADSRLVLGWLGKNVITAQGTWKPRSFGEPTWQAFDARDDRVLVRVGTGPRADGYVVARVTADGVRAEELATNSGELQVVAPSLLDAAPRAALSLMATPETSQLWRVTPDGRTLLAERPGGVVVFGVGPGSVAVVTQRKDGSIQLTLVEDGSTTDFALPRSPVRLGGGAVTFARRHVALGLVGGAGEVEGYIVDRSNGAVTLIGKLLPVAVVKDCP